MRTRDAFSCIETASFASVIIEKDLNKMAAETNEQNGCPQTPCPFSPDVCVYWRQNIERTGAIERDLLRVSRAATSDSKV